MQASLFTAATGMRAQQMYVDNIANNLANASTTGYKMRRAQFQDLLYQSMSQPGASAGQSTTVPAGLQLGLGTRASSNRRMAELATSHWTGSPGLSTRSPTWSTPATLREASCLATQSVCAWKMSGRRDE